MYSAPSASASTSKRRSPVIPIIGSILCGGLLLFLLAATIVLALIPIYLPQKSASLSSSKTKSNQVTIYSDTGVTATGRRRRDATSDSASMLQQCVAAGGSSGCSLGDDGKQMAKALIVPALQETGGCKDIDSLTITFIASSGRKRSLSRRKRQGLKIFMQIVFFIIFPPRCIGRCAQKKSSALTGRCKSLMASGGGFVLVNVNLYTSGGGLFGRLSRIEGKGVLKMSTIGTNDMSPFSGGFQPPPIFSIPGGSGSGSGNDTGNTTNTSTSTTTTISTSTDTTISTSTSTSTSAGSGGGGGGQTTTTTTATTRTTTATTSAGNIG